MKLRQIDMSKNRNFVANILFDAVMIIGIAMIPSAITAINGGDSRCAVTLGSMTVICAVAGFIGSRYITSDITSVKVKTCYIATTLTWLLAIILGTIPYYLAGYGFSLVDSFFESCAGWSTTGAAVLNIKYLPACLQLWNATCNWIGGLGMIVLAVTFIRSWQFTGHTLVRTEVGGPNFMESTMTFRATYRRILFIYITLTTVQFIIYMLCGLPFFTAINTALRVASSAGLTHFTTAETIGFSPALKIFITFFTFLSSVNFALFIVLMNHKWMKFFRATEFKGFVALILTGTVAANLSNMISGGFHHVLGNIGGAFMQIISFSSTSGYTITNTAGWTEMSRMILFFCCFIGASAFSTGGGLKMARFICIIKSIRYGIYTHVHPHSIKTQTYNGYPVKSSLIRKALVYAFLFFMAFIFGAFALSVFDVGLGSSLEASLAMLTNTGTMINHLGQDFLYSGFNAPSKVILSILMIAGRLEIYPVLLIFTPSFWRSDSAK